MGRLGGNCFATFDLRVILTGCPPRHLPSLIPRLHHKAAGHQLHVPPVSAGLADGQLAL